MHTYAYVKHSPKNLMHITSFKPHSEFWGKCFCIHSLKMRRKSSKWLTTFPVLRHLVNVEARIRIWVVSGLNHWFITVTTVTDSGWKFQIILFRQKKRKYFSNAWLFWPLLFDSAPWLYNQIHFFFFSASFFSSFFKIQAMHNFFQKFSLPRSYVPFG